MRLAKHNIARRSGLNTSELEVLVSLYHASDPLSIKHLSNDLMLCSQAITKICKNLQALGLIESRKSSIDRRITWVELSARGAVIAKEEKEYREGFLKQVLPSGTKHDALEDTFNTLSDTAMAMALEIEG